MANALGRLAVVMAKGAAGLRRTRAAREQQDFENERALAGESDARAYRDAMIETRRMNAESLAQQREAQHQEMTARQQLARELQQRQANERNNRLGALARKGVDMTLAPSIADDDVAWRRAMQPEPQLPAMLTDEAMRRRKEIADYPRGGGSALGRVRSQLPSRTGARSGDETPRFLRPDALGGRAAELTEPRKGQYGAIVPGLTPQAAADSARAEVEQQRQAGYRAELDALTAILAKAQSFQRGNPAKLKEIQEGYEREAAYLRRKYGIKDERE